MDEKELERFILKWLAPSDDFALSEFKRDLERVFWGGEP